MLAIQYRERNASEVLEWLQFAMEKSKQDCNILNVSIEMNREHTYVVSKVVIKLTTTDDAVIQLNYGDFLTRDIHGNIVVISETDWFSFVHKKGERA